MSTSIHRRLAEDAGMSLVEVMVSILILGVALAAFASTLTTSLVSLSRDETRVRATHLANEVVEDLRAMPWDQLGFYADDPGFAAAYSDASGTYDTVVLGAARSGAPGPQPAPQTTTVDGIAYTTTTNVYWLDDELDGLGAADADGDTHDVKAFAVTVEWTSRGEPYSQSTGGIRPPTIDEVPLGTPVAGPTVPPGVFAITVFEVAPTAVTISPSGTTQQEIVVTLETSEPAVVPTLQYNSTSIGMQAVTGSGGTQWTHTIAVGDSTFHPGSYDFVVDAHGVAGGTDSATVTVGFTQPSVQTVQVLTPTPAPGTVTFCKANGHKLRDPVTLEWEVLGIGSGDTVTFDWTDQTGSATPQFLGLNASGTGTRWRATIPQGQQLNKSTTTITIRAVRAVDGTVASEAFVYNVGSC